jgi:hypothetical protein
MEFNIANSSPEFPAKLGQRLTEYRNTAGLCLPQRCRLVQYAGADKPNGLDIAPAQVEHEISFALAESFVVDWLFQTSVLYIRIQEPGCPMPPWDKVKAEEALIDVDALLREAGFEV